MRLFSKRFRTTLTIMVVLLGGSLFLGGCAVGPKYIAKEYLPPQRIAVLLFSNDTNDVEGPETVRKALIEFLPQRGYVPVDKKQVDELLLKKFGITEGGQLGSANPQILGQVLQADGLMYGNLITFVDFPFGFGRKRTVKANFKLVDARTGQLLWEDEKSWTTPEIHLNVEEARKAAIRQVAERQLEKMTGKFLLEESRKVAVRALKNLPAAR